MKKTAEVSNALRLVHKVNCAPKAASRNINSCSSSQNESYIKNTVSFMFIYSWQQGDSRLNKQHSMYWKLVKYLSGHEQTFPVYNTCWPSAPHFTAQSQKEMRSWHPT